MNAGASIDGNPVRQLKLNLITIANNTIHTEIKTIFLKGIKKF